MMSGVIDQEVVLRDGRRVRVREAEARDGAGVVVLMRSVAAERGFTLFEPEEMDAKAAGIAKRVGVRDEDDLRLIARCGEGDEDVIADLTLGAHGFRRIAHVAKMGMEVRRDFRSVGLGDAMLGMALAWARAHARIARVELQVVAENVPAMALYRKHGFVEEGRRRNYMLINGRYVDDVVMGMFVKDI